MRISNSIKNIYIGILSQIVITILGFISRKVFLNSLGTEYLGVNGLLTSILSMLALIESGIGTSIVYNLYRPLAENDRPKIIALIQLYKRAYAVLALIIFGMSIALYPFLGRLIKDSGPIPYLTVAYFIFVARNIVTYLNAHKVSLINADQKGFVLARINFGFQVVTMIARIAILILTKNYVIYLSIELAIFILQMIINGWIVDKRYSYIKIKEKYSIDENIKNNLLKNIKALFFHNIGTYCVFGTDNILISSFVSILTVGLYSNYTMIIEQLGAVITPILSGVGASVGNLLAVESNEKSYSVFKVLYLVNFWIYSFCVIFLYNLLEPFINWWLGMGYLLDSFTFVVVLVNFYITGLRSSILTFKAKGGIFVQDQYMPLVEGFVNLGAGLLLVKYLGLAGIFLGTTISSLSIVFWNAPRLVYKHIFNKPLWPYFKQYIFYVILTLISCFITTNICKFLVAGNGFMSLVARGIICVIIPNAIYVALFYRSEEFRYIKNVIRILFIGFKAKLTSVNYLTIGRE